MNQQQATARAQTLANRTHTTRYIVQLGAEYRDVDETTLETCFPSLEPVETIEPKESVQDES